MLYFVLGYLLTLLMNALEVRAKSRLGTGPTLREIFGLAPVFDQPVGARS